MISTADFKPGLTVQIDGEVFQIVEFQHVKPGKGGAFVRTKLRNLRTSSVFDRTYRAGERFDPAILERREMEFLYRSGEEYVMMDQDSFEQVPMTAEGIGPGVKYLKENMAVTVVSHQGQVIGVEMPHSVVLEVAQTDPGLRGDTASGGSKPATLETGAVIQVPLFVNVGDRIRVDTRSDQYLERA